MNERFLLAAVLLPLLGGALLPLTHKRGAKVMYGAVYAITAATSLLTWALILTCGAEEFTAVSLTQELTLTLRFDGLGRFFAGIVATLRASRGEDILAACGLLAGEHASRAGSAGGVAER